jgi:N-acetylmuramoyl-L-alanine amidase/Putative peptidoglycan binding domain
MRRYLAALVAILAALGIAVTATITLDEDGTPVITIRIDGPDSDTRPDDPLVLNEDAQDIREDTGDDDTFLDVAEPMRGFDRARAGVLDGPLAAQEWPGCKTAFVRSFSSRRGVKPRAVALHYTAGPNHAGWADLDGLTAYSNNVANQVSWHFGVDREGHCTYNVPVNHKAWTIAALNSETVNLEIVGTGREPDYAGAIGTPTVARIVGRVSKLYGIPLRLGSVSNCHVTRTGIITHWMGGSCAGGHHDIKPYELVPVIAKLRALADVPKPKPAPPCTPLNIEKVLHALPPAESPPLVVDGRLGVRVAPALRRFQRANGLDVDGVIGPKTGAALGLRGCAA